MRAPALLLFALLLLAPGCTPGQKALWCKTLNAIDMIEPAVSVALPFLVPQLAAEYTMLAAAVDAAKAPLVAGCARGEEGPQIDTAVNASVALLQWWQVHRAEVNAASPPGTRDVRAPDESAQVLADLQAYQAKRGAR